MTIPIFPHHRLLVFMATCLKMGKLRLMNDLIHLASRNLMNLNVRVAVHVCITVGAVRAQDR